MITVKPLKPEQFKRLEKIFLEEFESDPPLPESSEIFAAFEDGKMIGFILATRIQLLGQIYVAPQKREKSSEIVRSLLSLVRQKYDGKETVGAVASESRFKKLYESLGLQHIPGEFYRKNTDF